MSPVIRICSHCLESITPDTDATWGLELRTSIGTVRVDVSGTDDVCRGCVVRAVEETADVLPIQTRGTG